MPKWAGTGCAVALVLALATPLGAQETGTDAAPAPTAATVVASVNGTDITLGHMAAVRASLPPQYRELPDDVLFDGILEQLVQQVALAAEGEAAITPRQELELQSQRWSYLSGAVLNGIAEAAVTEEALQKLFDEKYGNAAASKEFSAAHILVETEEDAKAAKAELDAGGDFAAIAKERSSDPGSAQNGGDLGWFGLGMMVPEFEAAVIALTPGQVSEPVQTQFGWHIIRLNETRDRAVTLDEVRDELVGELQEKAVEAKVKELTDAATITRSAEGIDKAILKDGALLGE